MILTLKRTAAVISAAIIGYAPAAIAQQNVTYYAGESSDGRRVVLDLSSLYASGNILESGRYHASFVYFLDSERLPSQANCSDDGTWKIRGAGPVYAPESRAEQNMLNTVCGELIRYMNVSNPDRPMEPIVPRVAVLQESVSEIKTSPNGDTLCTVEGRGFINIHGHLDDWYSTDICRGELGVIHESQINYLEPSEIQWEDVPFYTPSSPLL